MGNECVNVMELLRLYRATSAECQDKTKSASRVPRVGIIWANYSRREGTSTKNTLGTFETNYKNEIT